MRKSIVSALLALVCANASAQFYTNGDDPASLRWQSVETQFYKIIYPVGADSLARVYGTLLEQFRVPMGKSIGMTPGDVPRGKMPVILHTHNPYSNGSVAWAPQRMDLYTLPETYGPDPYPWEVQLAAHEPRHQAQMQLAYKGGLKVGTWLIGEGFSPIAWALFLDSPLGEGDAVAAETGLAVGRARTADFLNYYRVAYDQGDFRTWNRWRFGSFKYEAPDHYTIGYMTIAGERVFGENPLAVKDLMDHSAKAPWDWSPYNFKSTRNFRKYAEAFNALWQEDTRARAPFMEAERLSPKEDFPVDYVGFASIDDDIYMLREGFAHNTELVKYSDGEFERLHTFSSYNSGFFSCEETGKLYWTETIRHPRWGLEGKSIVRSYDVESGKIQDITTKGRLYNPHPSEDGSRILVEEYPYEGGSAVLVLDAESGAVLERYSAPAGVQATEAEWLEDEIYVLGLEHGGYSLYEIAASGSWKRHFGPVVAKIVDIGAGDDCLEFIADLNGVNELYQYFPESGKAVQVTSLRYGGGEFCQVGDYMYYVSQCLDGLALHRTPVSALANRPADLSKAHSYPVEDALTAQETALGGVVDHTAPVEFSSPKPYSKILNPLKFHTWAPLYINYDSIMEDSFDFTYDNISPGATVFFQNDLGTVSGSLGAAIHPDEDKEKGWRGAFHGILKYTGQYPVLEATLDVGDNRARQYRLVEYASPASAVSATAGSIASAPVVLASLAAYVPLTFNKGGWLRGFVPKLRYSVSNNMYMTAPMLYTTPAGFFEDIPSHYVFSGFGDGSNVLVQTLGASVRGYSMLPTTHSRVYPRLGLGAEAGYFTRLGMSPVYAPNAYAYTYGYLPGFYQTHGFKLSAMFQTQIRRGESRFGEMSASTVPRGFDGAVGSAVAMANRWQARFTADYAMPFTIGGDLSLMPVLYIRNFVLTPNVDFTLLPKGGNLWSVGADLTANLGYVIVAALDASAGITVSKLGGSWFGPSGQKDSWYIGPVFSMDF